MALKRTSKQIIAFALSAAVLSQAFAVCAFAKPAERSETVVTNNISSGDIDIEIAETMLDESGSEVPYVDGRKIFPGEVVSKIVRIENKAEPAWLRVKVSEKSSAEWFTDDLVKIDEDSGWVKKGEYFYYPEEVPSGSSVTFMTGFEVPSELGNLYEDTTCDVLINAEAVQSRNFTPDMEADDPWFGTVIELCVHEDAYDPGMGGSDAFSVEFKDGTEGMIHIGDDFFANWSNIMPGDTYSDKAIVKNSSAVDANIYFYSENPEPENTLLQSLRLDIMNGDEVVYSGNLAGTSDPVLLGEYSQGDTSDFTFSVSMPKEYKNEYSRNTAVTKWIFYAEYHWDYMLPETGGIGTVPVLIGGLGVLLTGAVIFGVTRRRKHA